MKTLMEQKQEQLKASRKLQKDVTCRLRGFGWTLISTKDPFNNRNRGAGCFDWDMEKIVAVPIDEVRSMPDGTKWPGIGWHGPVICFKGVSQLLIWIDGGCLIGPTAKVLEAIKDDQERNSHE